MKTALPSHLNSLGSSYTSGLLSYLYYRLIVGNSATVIKLKLRVKRSQ